MVTYFFYSFEDDLSQHTHSDVLSSFDTYPFEDSNLFSEEFQLWFSYFEEYQDMDMTKKLEVHSSKMNYFNLGYNHEYF
jgi:hypothetical protein